MFVGPAGEQRAFQEMPEQSEPNPTNPKRANASMGNYVLNSLALAENPLAKEILSGNYAPGDTVHVREKSGQVVFAKA